MLSSSNNDLSIKRDSDIKSDFEYLKRAVNIDLFSLYIETRSSVSVMSNLPYYVKESYRNEGWSDLDPMINNHHHGLFMCRETRNAKETAFNDVINDKFGINNLYARASTLGSVKISYVVGSFSQRDTFIYHNAIDDKVIGFSKEMINKYISDLSLTNDDIKFSGMVLNPMAVQKTLFSDKQIQKPNYGELACLSLAKDGLSAEEISKLTGYKLSTVHSNLKNVREKLIANKTIDAAVKAISLGWIS
ncbi:helix-turn-helix transcriptional regulator [Vibrio neptunius]|uniref:helix-turn-helix transcriptional regulator n=1 Tax=Vibrio neptunius TaxID=170651 RepID=UPI0019D0C735|nr:hypothetical protein [Vibrio neptunius]MBN3574091.1 hypothetical protein [Vibrio neptunius]QXX09063.1 hypothetical protein KW548_18405 [Vibrio neptunius]